MGFVPCDDCDGDQCTMNCGPAMVDARGILKCAVEEYEAAGTHVLTTKGEAAAMRSAVRGLLVRLGLYHSFDRHLETDNEERDDY